MIVVDVETHYARAAAKLLFIMSGGMIRWRSTWMVRPGEPVWRWELDQ
jgi:hypothetical protein